MKANRIFMVVSFLCLALWFSLPGCAQKDEVTDEEPKDHELVWVTDSVSGPGLSYYTFFSQAAGTRVSFHVFAPEPYRQNSQMRLPVLYWLHGSGGDQSRIPLITSHFRSAMQQGVIPLMLIVFPYGLPNGMWCDSKDGTTMVETMIISELVPLIDTGFRTIANRSGRLLEGFSMGGYGAARLGFKYPWLFAGISMLGAGPLQPDLFDGVYAGNAALAEYIFRTVYGNSMDYFFSVSPWSLATSYAANLTDPLRIRVAVGTDDFTHANNLIFSNHLKDLGIEHDLFTPLGTGHAVMPLFMAMDGELWTFFTELFPRSDPAFYYHK